MARFVVNAKAIGPEFDIDGNRTGSTQEYGAGFSLYAANEVEAKRKAIRNFSSMIAAGEAMLPPECQISSVTVTRRDKTYF